MSSPLRVKSTMPSEDIANNETVDMTLKFFQQTLSVFAKELSSGELPDKVREAGETQMQDFFATLVKSGRMTGVPKFSIIQSRQCRHHQHGMIMLMIEPNEFRKCLGLPECRSVLYEEIFPILQ